MLSISHSRFSMQFNMERRLMDGTLTADQDHIPAALPVSEGQNSYVGNFWDVLNPTQRRDFAALATQQAFSAGQILMRQGERANHVAMISAGRVRISVRDGDRDRILAERGPGDLVGERAALQVNERSATVAALEPIRALIMKTEDLATFVKLHPAVLRILELQIYERLSEGEASQAPADEQPLCGQNCTVVFTDVVGFADPARSELDRLAIRRATADMTRAALQPFWSACEWADRGDGLLIIVPPRIPTTAVLEALMTVLSARLELHNASQSLAVRVQLRVAVIVGPVTADTLGLSGQAIIRAARMLDAPIFKEAMAQTDVPLGVIASGFVYDTVIQPGGELLDPGGFFPVQVKVKESEMIAWMYLRAPAGGYATWSPTGDPLADPTTRSSDGVSSVAARGDGGAGPGTGGDRAF